MSPNAGPRQPSAIRPCPATGIPWPPSPAGAACAATSIRPPPMAPPHSTPSAAPSPANPGSPRCPPPADTNSRTPREWTPIGLAVWAIRSGYLQRRREGQPASAAAYLVVGLWLLIDTAAFNLALPGGEIVGAVLAVFFLLRAVQLRRRSGVWRGRRRGHAPTPGEGAGGTDT